MNAPAGIEPDKDRVTPVGCQCELNPCNNALPSPTPPNQSDRFADVQVGGLHAGRNRFVFKRHFLEWAAPEQPARISDNHSVMHPAKYFFQN